jgi:hypothetical protein
MNTAGSAAVLKAALAEFDLDADVAARVEEALARRMVVDWTEKSDVQREMRAAVKRLLEKAGEFGINAKSLTEGIVKRAKVRADVARRMPLVLVAYSDTQSDAPGEISAVDRYTSPLFKKALGYARGLTWENNIGILSARHGLLKGYEATGPGDPPFRQMPAAERRAWGQRVRAQLDKINGQYPTAVVILAGEDFAEALGPFDPFPPVTFPLHGLRVGEQEQWLDANRVDTAAAFRRFAEEAKRGPIVVQSARLPYALEISYDAATHKYRLSALPGSKRQVLIEDYGDAVVPVYVRLMREGVRAEPPRSTPALEWHVSHEVERVEAAKGLPARDRCRLCRVSSEGLAAPRLAPARCAEAECPVTGDELARRVFEAIDRLADPDLGGLATTGDVVQAVLQTDPRLTLDDVHTVLAQLADEGRIELRPASASEAGLHAELALPGPRDTVLAFLRRLGSGPTSAHPASDRDEVEDLGVALRDEIEDLSVALRDSPPPESIAGAPSSGGAKRRAASVRAVNAAPIEPYFLVWGMGRKVYANAAGLAAAIKMVRTELSGSASEANGETTVHMGDTGDVTFVDVSGIEGSPEHYRLTGHPGSIAFMLGSMGQASLGYRYDPELTRSGDDFFTTAATIDALRQFPGVDVDSKREGAEVRYHIPQIGSITFERRGDGSYTVEPTNDDALDALAAKLGISVPMAVARPASSRRAPPAPAPAPAAETHLYRIGEDLYGDTRLIDIGKQLSGYRLHHMGGPDFEIIGPLGEIQFDPYRGKDFPGRSGRSHQLYSNNTDHRAVMDRFLADLAAVGVVPGEGQAA